VIREAARGAVEELMSGGDVGGVRHGAARFEDQYMAVDPRNVAGRARAEWEDPYY